MRYLDTHRKKTKPSTNQRTPSDLCIAMKQRGKDQFLKMLRSCSEKYLDERNHPKSLDFFAKDFHPTPLPLPKPAQLAHLWAKSHTIHRQSAATFLAAERAC
jgi:hypothetical protein